MLKLIGFKDKFKSLKRSNTKNGWLSEITKSETYLINLKQNNKTRQVLLDNVLNKVSKNRKKIDKANMKSKNYINIQINSKIHKLYERSR